MFAYFFGPLRDELPRPEQIADCTPDAAVMACRFFDETLRSGRWPVIKSTGEWSRADWPMPEFSTDSFRITGEAWVSTYADDDPSLFVRQRRIPPEEEAAYPLDEFFDPYSLERLIAERLGGPQVDDGLAETESIEEGVRHALFVPAAAVDDVRRELGSLGFHEVAVDDERDGVVYLEAFLPGKIADLRSSVDEMEKRLIALAHRVGGEYDGREWALG